MSIDFAKTGSDRRCSPQPATYASRPPLRVRIEAPRAGDSRSADRLPITPYVVFPASKQCVRRMLRSCLEPWKEPSGSGEELVCRGWDGLDLPARQLGGAEN